MIALFVFVIGWAISRLLQERALSQLDATSRVAMLDRLSVLRKLSPVMLVLVFMLMFALPGAALPALGVYFGTLVALSFQRLRGLDLPRAFWINYWGGQAVLAVALAAYLALLQGWVRLPL